MDSSAAFGERAIQVGVSQDHLTSLINKGLDTYGAFAFISSFQPGGVDETPFVRAIYAALEVPQNSLTEVQLSAFRRLYYESHTLALGDLRSRLERKDNDEPRKIPMAERAQRLQAMRADLPGVTIDLQLEPAHRLVDQVVQQIEENCIRYIPLKECLSRSSELLNHKHELAVEFQSDGTLRLSKRQKEIHADVQGDLKLKMAFQRRALAYHMAGAANFVEHDKVISAWFSLLTKDPASGYKAVSLQQLVMADQELWLQIAQCTRGKVLSSTPKPVDEAMYSLKDSPEVRYHLLPLPMGPAKREGDHANDQPRKKHKPANQQKGGGKSKGKGKQPISLPKNCVSTTPSGERICFQYNRDRCNQQSADRCVRGVHVCWKSGCHAKHPFSMCTVQ